MGGCARARALMCVYLRACVRDVFVCAHVCLRMRNPWNQICHFALNIFFKFSQQEKGIDDMHTDRKLGAPAEKQNGKREISSECAGPQEELLKERRENVRLSMTTDLMYLSFHE